MNISSSVVKKTARTALKGKYFKAVIVSCIFVFAWLVLYTCYAILRSIAGLYFSVRLIFGSDCEPLTLFKYFSGAKEYFKALKLSLTLSGNAVLMGIFLFLPAIFCDLVANGYFFKMLNM